ncbi:hypothetical protein F4806DRAFT_264189 [Annulohypoxylon nitens]|nr:hypothetical protein F4806DRAFT_264189 [Annulohypoxylon nitens]
MIPWTVFATPVWPSRLGQAAYFSSTFSSWTGQARPGHRIVSCIVGILFRTRRLRLLFHHKPGACATPGGDSTRGRRGEEIARS